jgi:hypothetical protein
VRTKIRDVRSNPNLQQGAFSLQTSLSVSII